MSRTSRLMQLMQSLRRRPPPVRAADLAADTGVSIRTLYRDVAALREMGAVIDGTAGYGYALIEDTALPPLMFDDEEIEALVLGLREVQAIGDPALAGAAGNALAKIQRRLPGAQAQRLRYAVLTADRMAPLPVPDIDIRALRKAAWDERIVSFAYTDVAGTSTRRSVKPLSIVYLRDSLHLIAWCLLRKDFRNFRLDRMATLVVTDDSFRPHRVPLLREALAQLSADWPKARTVMQAGSAQSG